MPTSLITGGAGFLGSHLCEELLRRGHRVICVDNLETGSLANIHHIRDSAFIHRNIDIIEPYFVAPAAGDAQGRVLRDPPHAGSGQVPPGAVPDRLDQ